MPGAGRRTERLKSLATSVGVPRSDPCQGLTRSAVIEPSNQDVEIVDRALSATRLQDSDSRKWYRRSSSSGTTYTRGEATEALVKLVHSTGCSPGQALELIRRGAEIIPRGSKRWMRSRSQDHGEIQSSLFLHIVENSDVALINAVAHKADQAHLNVALKRAFAQRDLEKVKVLLAVGCGSSLGTTDPYRSNSQHNMDATAISSTHPSMITAETATECLPDAMLLRDLQVIRVLLALNADAGANHSSAMIDAVAYELPSIMAALCLAPCSPSPNDLATILGAFCYKHQTDPIPGFLLTIIEIMLAAGAEGSKVSEALYKATSRKQHVLVQLLTEYTGFDREWDPRALKLAMEHGDLDLFSILRRKMSRQDIINVITQDITDDMVKCLTIECQSTSPEIRLQMMKSLCHLRPSTEVLNAALVTASELDETDAVAFLVSQYASVSYRSGEALVAAIGNQSTKTFRALLRGETCSQSILQDIMGRTQRLPIPLRLYFVCGLLQFDVGRQALNEALYAASKDYDGSSDGQRLIASLVKADADVNISNGQCFVLAGQREDSIMMSMLLEGSPNNTSLERAFEAVLRVKDFELKLSLLSSILDAGAFGASIDGALCRAIDGSDQGRRLANLILSRGRPNVNFDNSEAVIRAIKWQEPELLRLMADLEPSLDVVGEALLKCIKRLARDITLGTHRDMAQIRMFFWFDGVVDHDSGKPIVYALARSDDEVLSTLLEAPTQSETLWEGLKYILDGSDDPDRKFQLAQMFFNTRATLSPESLGQLLHKTYSQHGSRKLLQLFLDHGASVNNDTLETFKMAIEYNDQATLKLLLDKGASEGTVAKMFDHAWNFKDTTDVDLLKVFTNEPRYRVVIDFDQYLTCAVRNGPQSLHLAEYLLDLGASVESCGSECLHMAALRLDIDTLALLLLHTKNQSSVTDVFGAVIREDAVWSNPSGVPVVKALLSGGATGDYVDQSLLAAVERRNTSANAKAIFEHLVDYQACADYEHGLVLEKAVRQGDLELVTKLFYLGPSILTIANAFPYIFTSFADEETTLALIEAFVSCSDSESYINVQHKELEPVVFLAMQKWPKSWAITQALLYAGASSDQRLQYSVMPPVEPESVTPLLWALCQPNQIISDAIIKLLIQVSDVNFTPESSDVSPLIAATRGGRKDIVDLLLDLSASSSPDCRGWTPLCYASVQDDTDLLRSLLMLGGRANDGSLHHAVSNCRVAQASILLEHGHDPNYLSKWHGSQPAMEVLIKHQDRPHSFQKMKKMFELLREHGADIDYQSEGKSLLFMALDSHEAESIVPALLEAFMGTMVNDDLNLYHANQKHIEQDLDSVVVKEVVYSPLSYVIHDQQESGNWYKRELSNVLQAFGCRQVYYHKTGRQPLGFVGAPESIREMERQRIQLDETTAEEEERHQLALRRNREIAQAELERKNQLHAAELERRREAEAEFQLVAQQNHRLQLAQKAEAAAAQKRQLKYAQMINDETERALRQAKEQLLLRQQGVVDAQVNAEHHAVELAQTGGAVSERSERRALEKSPGLPLDYRRYGVLSPPVSARSSQFTLASQV